MYILTTLHALICRPDSSAHRVRKPKNYAVEWAKGFAIEGTPTVNLRLMTVPNSRRPSLRILNDASRDDTTMTRALFQFADQTGLPFHDPTCLVVLCIRRLPAAGFNAQTQAAARTVPGKSVAVVYRARRRPQRGRLLPGDATAAAIESIGPCSP